MLSWALSTSSRPVPIGFSLDAKPAVNIGSYSGFFPNNLFGASVRYYFGRKIVVRVENPEDVERPATRPEPPTDAFPATDNNKVLK